MLSSRSGEGIQSTGHGSVPDGDIGRRRYREEPGNLPFIDSPSRRDTAAQARCDAVMILQA